MAEDRKGGENKQFDGLGGKVFTGRSSKCFEVKPSRFSYRCGPSDKFFSYFITDAEGRHFSHAQLTDESRMVTGSRRASNPRTLSICSTVVCSLAWKKKRSVYLDFHAPNGALTGFAL